MTMAGSNNKSTWTKNALAGAHASAVKGAATSLEDRFTLARINAAPDSVTLPPSGTAGPASIHIAAPVRVMPLESILDRDTDLRPLNADHAKALALSFAAVGMLQFPVIDEKDRLLAGAHRRAAIRLLKDLATANDDDVRAAFPPAGDDDPLTADEIANVRSAWATHFAAGIPVRVVDTTPYSADQIRLIIETIENELRLDFNKADLAHLIERLKKLGYRNMPGRPTAGQRVLSHELARITKKSTRTVFRMLKEMREGTHNVDPIEPSRAAKIIEARLRETLDTKVRVHESKTERGKGSISIAFESFHQRKKILEALGLRD
jgi:hypothetical protein